jgi:MsuE subfamily FMN reductase
MTETVRIVGVSGSLQAPSKTITLVEEIVGQLSAHFTAEITIIKVNELGPAFAGALTRAELSPEVEAALVAIETADVLVVASPVYRASFTGLFKHLFDFVDQYALVDTPTLLAATGGSERHALIIEHQFRPLFAFFQALTLPVGSTRTTPTSRITSSRARGSPIVCRRRSRRPCRSSIRTSQKENRSPGRWREKYPFSPRSIRASPCAW